MLPDNVKKVHFIGIGGYGMSALAMILLRKGYGVSGSDMKSSRLSERLVGQGADVKIGHDATNIGDCDMVVYSTAIPDDNPEMVECRRLSLPLWHRSELLADLVNNYYGIAVAGTHGKTTTTAMISLLLDKAGLDPTAVIGGELSVYDGNARLGKSDYLVAEACESDNSFLRYFPRIAVITNIEADHLENYEGDFNKLRMAYEEFLFHVSPAGCAVLCADDHLVMDSSMLVPGRVVTYGISDGEKGDCGAGEMLMNNEAPHYAAKDISYAADGTSVFSVYLNDSFIAEVHLGAPGRHNVLNAVGAIATAAQLDDNIAESVSVLKDFSGVGRRFEVIGDVNNILVVDDYAHHPTEIKATLQAARAMGRERVYCLFQPHRYSRTGFFMEDYATAFGDADKVFLNSVYAAGESPVEGVSSEVMAGLIRERDGKDVVYGDDLSALAAEAGKILQSGDIIITMGAGDVWKASRIIVDLLRES